MSRFSLLLASVLVAVGALLALACLPGCERPCDVEGARRCDGSMLVVCGGGRWVRALDCASETPGAWVCAPGDAGTASCKRGPGMVVW